MKRIDPNNLPVLPLSGIIGEDCVALGIIDDSFVISYLDRDYAVAFDFEELVKMGNEFDKTEEVSDIREIPRPAIG